MALRTGEQYLRSLQDGRRVHINGERVADVTTHPAFAGVLGTLAGLYDANHDPALREALTTVDPVTGDRHSTTLLAATSYDDVLRRVRCDRIRTDLTYGMMGRLPDFMNAYLLDVRSSLLHAGKQAEADKVGDYLELLRREDLAVTHTLVDPQSDRSTQDAPAEAVHVVERRDDGIVIAGARLLSTLAPVANEVFVGPYAPRPKGQEDYALAFTLPMNTEGLTIMCRQAYDDGEGTFDAPLSGRFDEGDAILIFDDVFVPTERIIVDGDLAAYNSIVGGAAGFGPLQGTARSVAKLRFLVGLASIAATTVGRDSSPRYREEIGEIAGLLNVAEGLLDAAALDLARRLETRRLGADAAVPGPGEAEVESLVGICSLAFFFPYAMAKAFDVVRLVAGSGAITFTQGELCHEEIGALVEKYVHGPAGVDATRRLQVMRMVADATAGRFAARQALYERYYTGDPVLTRTRFYGSPKTAEAERMVERLLNS